MKYFFGPFLLLWSVMTVRYIQRWVREGEAYLVMSVGGDGLVGRANKDDEPVIFWFNVAINYLIAIAAALLGIAILAGFVKI